MRAREVRELFRVKVPPVCSDDRALASAYTVEDLRRAARRRVPRAVFGYMDGGSEDEITLARNVDAFRRVELVSRVLVDVDAVDPSTAMLSARLPAGFALAPTGFSRLVHFEGESAVARAAAAAGVPYTLSTVATTSIEDVATVAPTGTRWFQLYVARDREISKELMERARAAGYDVLVLTVDVPVSGARERDLRSGFTIPPAPSPRTLLNGVLHPTWSWRFLTSEPVSFANVTIGPTAPVSVMEQIHQMFDPSVEWSDVEWMLEQWDGPMLLKGIMSATDARQAADVGVAGVVVSNHGGRQLDRAPATLDVLPEIVEAVGDRVDVLFDGGIRRGSDVVTALALGAKAAMVGRAYLYGLGAAGERGVARAIEILDGEVRRTMALLGARSVAELGPHVLRRS